MSDQLIQKFTNKHNTKKVPAIKIGDTVVVDTIIRDGDKQRIQKFKGLVIAVSGKGNDKTFTVRKISYGVGVEKIFPLYSTNISKIEVQKHSSVRRAKLFYLRGRVGKAAMKLKAGEAVTPEEHANEVVTEEEIEPVVLEVESNTAEEANSQTAVEVESEPVVEESESKGE